MVFLEKSWRLLEEKSNNIIIMSFNGTTVGTAQGKYKIK